MGPCAVRMGPGAGRRSGCVRGGPCSSEAVGAGRKVRGVEAAAAMAAATASGLGSNPAANDLGRSLGKAREPYGETDKLSNKDSQFGCGKPYFTPNPVHSHELELKDIFRKSTQHLH